ncbi:helix-turn-helix domain-containing protein [Nocardioides jensenii]|uniref:helix-turn-helix domain-containing protein n=1 Tax=Nocardioides jensenii TaxID=1843 RepID=UPI0009E723BA|nr:AraC family transcriptional regulator [Nocardioides jensenii]
MGSWTNATASRPARRSLPPDARRPSTSTDAGILRPDQFAKYVELDRPAPDPALDRWIEHYWTVRWDLPVGSSYLSEVVPHPAVHVTVESGSEPHHGLAMPAALVHGVVTRRFSIDVSGEGRSFGIKFRPGGFGAWTGEDVGAWTDRIEPLEMVFGADAATLLHDVLAEASDLGRAGVMDEFLLSRLPAPDPTYDRVLAIVADLVADPALVTVEQVASRHAMSVRTLQRLFRRYVGVGPKWVLQRHRLHDAVTLIDAGEYADLADLATRLGWFDQAHFTRDFTDLVGMSPRAYAAR